jgi:hypothetical protein
MASMNERRQMTGWANRHYARPNSHTKMVRLMTLAGPDANIEQDEVRLNADSEAGRWMEHVRR